MSPVGKTKDAGWQIGVSRTLPVPLEDVWSLLTSEAGLAVWLGEGAAPLPTERGAEIRTADGGSGELRSHRPHDRIRLTWRPPGADSESTLQVAVTGSADKTILRFHQERLSGADEREAQREHWQQVMERLVEAGGW